MFVLLEAGAHRGRRELLAVFGGLTFPSRNGRSEARLRRSVVDLLAAQFPTLRFLLSVGGQHFQTGGGELPTGW